MKSVIAIAVSLALAGGVVAQENQTDAKEEQSLESAGETRDRWMTILQSLRIIGSSEDARRVSGTGAVIDPERMRIEAQPDINQLLKTVPGVYIREEEGQGLRPNIGIRAAAGGRSSKVTLMEDGVLIAPAPYSNPAAYYFPEAFQMHAIEVLKGAPLLRYGPQTTGGVINLVTTPIPAENSGRVITTLGEHSEHNTHAWYGGRSGNFGWLVDAVRRNTAGFKDTLADGFITVPDDLVAPAMRVLELPVYSTSSRSDPSRADVRAWVYMPEKLAVKSGTLLISSPARPRLGLSGSPTGG